MHFGAVGVFPVFDYVFRDHGWQRYKIDFARIIPARLVNIANDELEKDYRRMMRTYQISDHFPKWAEFRIEKTSAKSATHRDNAHH